MTIETRMLGLGDDKIFKNIAPGVFDNSCDPVFMHLMDGGYWPDQ